MRINQYYFSQDYCRVKDSKQPIRDVTYCYYLVDSTTMYVGRAIRNPSDQPDNKKTREFLKQCIDKAISGEKDPHVVKFTYEDFKTIMLNPYYRSSVIEFIDEKVDIPLWKAFYHSTLFHYKLIMDKLDFSSVYFETFSHFFEGYAVYRSKYGSYANMNEFSVVFPPEKAYYLRNKNESSN